MLANAQLSLEIDGLLFHSIGGSFNNPTLNPGTPVLIDVDDDAHSGKTVVGSLAINTENLDIDNFIEIVSIDELQLKVVFWLNGRWVMQPSLLSISMVSRWKLGVAGSFVGFERADADIRFLSIVSRAAAGFTIGDLTYAADSKSVDEPPLLASLSIGLVSLMAVRWRPGGAPTARLGARSKRPTSAVCRCWCPSESALLSPVESG